MKYPIYSMRDSKVGFGTPFVETSDVTAQRGFAFAINNKDGIMGFSPSDFDLYRLGWFDTESGQIGSEDVPFFIVSGSSVFGA